MTDNPCTICVELENLGRDIDEGLKEARLTGDYETIEILGRIQSPVAQIENHKRICNVGKQYGWLIK